jgi:hypothetical protein
MSAAKIIRTYGWKRGHQHKGDPQVIGEHVEALRTVHGGFLSAEDVVADAGARGSPMHGEFEWNDARAGHQHRLTQVRDLLRSITVEVLPNGINNPVITRAFIAVEPDESRGRYTSVEVVMSDPTLRAQALAQAKRELAALSRKYSDLPEPADILATIQSFLDRAEQAA